jgi:hypothetical protein
MRVPALPELFRGNVGLTAKMRNRNASLPVRSVHAGS